ncbi:hypothetical protein [Glycomyces xiaoerkulensis]|uniref:hypothetical protein n=1 Tax=Glycomyces xiaoerkulensis TaxID=2038139 RepID=UPI000C25B1A8|nr:hypothetical protein [Glycomyces xiaoerkulensis]
MRDHLPNPEAGTPIAPFPPATSVVHVGPHKTGTTAVQASMHAARERLGEHGVRLPSPKRNPVDEVREGVGSNPRDPARPAWSRLVAQFAENDDRVDVVSSEFFADADDRACRRVVSDLGGPQAHVLITLRPLAKIMPSQWQQHVQSGMHTPYEEWLAELLRPDTDDRASAIFWHRHRHDAFVERWTAAADPERVTVLVVDDSKPERLLRDFEAMLGLPEGTLRNEKNATNRSLTAGETEAIRRTAAAFEQRQWPKELFREYIRYGVVPRIKTNRKPGPGEAKIATPAWALDRAAEIGAEMADRIAASGVRVIGDLGVLRGDDIKAAEPGEPLIDPEATVQAIVACMNVAMKHYDATAPRPEAEPEPGGARDSLLRIVTQRARGRLSRNRAKR